MALYDSADLLAKCQTYANRPSVDETFDAAFWFGRLTEAQAAVTSMVVAHCPWLLIGDPVLLTSNDGGVTYPFGTDLNGYPLTPLYAELYARVSGGEWIATSYDGPGDFVIEATQIRRPANRARAVSAGPYARFVAPPGLIDETHQPTFRPPMDRDLLVWKALELWATVEGARDPLPYEKQFARMWAACLSKWKKQYSTQWMASVHGESPWWARMVG